MAIDPFPQEQWNHSSRQMIEVLYDLMSDPNSREMATALAVHLSYVLTEMKKIGVVEKSQDGFLRLGVKLGEAWLGTFAQLCVGGKSLDEGRIRAAIIHVIRYLESLAGSTVAREIQKHQQTVGMLKALMSSFGGTLKDHPPIKPKEKIDIDGIIKDLEKKWKKRKKGTNE